MGAWFGSPSPPREIPKQSQKQALSIIGGAPPAPSNKQNKTKRIQEGQRERIIDRALALYVANVALIFNISYGPQGTVKSDS